MLEDPVGPDSVRRALSLISDAVPVLVFIDEFDRVGHAATHALMADVVKIISDQAINATIVVIGVGDTVDELVREHASVQRSMVQVHMPRMDDTELAEIVTSGMEACEMEVDPRFVAEVANLSQ